MRDLIGRTLGHYRIVEKIGEGGMGVVYRAHDERLDRDVAIKVLPEAVAQDPDRLVRFEREAKAVAKLDHPNILAIHDFGTDDGVTYAVTELLEGNTLRDRIPTGGMGWQPSTEIGVAVADGLAAAHGKGVIHRDIKPSNIFLCSDGRVKILDFGLATTHGVVDNEAETGSMEAPLTSQGTVMGTVGYMAPEQVRGEPADHRSDIFALGCVLYETLTGERAFKRDTNAETMTAVLREEPPSVAASGVQVPPDVAKAVQHCLEKNPERRFQSAADVAFALASESEMTESPVVSSEASRLRRRAMPLFAIAGILVVASAMVFAPGILSLLGGKIESASIRSLAVLPFENLSGNPADEVFCDGMTEALITELGKISALQVIGRPSVMRFKRSGTPLGEIADILDVNGLIAGSYMAVGEKTRITIQLIDPSDERVMWSRAYEPTIKDVLGLQGQVARAISRQIRVTLTPDQERRLRRRGRPVIPEAQEAYVKGQNLRFRFEDTKSLPYFEKAVEIDPTFAEAHAAIADVLRYPGFLGSLEKQIENENRARLAIDAAMRIDPELAETYAVWGLLEWQYGWDWTGAETVLRRAVDLNPSSVISRTYLGLFLVQSGRFDEGLKHVQTANKLDPLSLRTNIWLSFAYHYARRYEESITLLEFCRDQHPRVADTYLALNYWATGAFDKAIAICDQEEYGDITVCVSVMGRAGRREMTEEKLRIWSDDPDVNPIRLSFLHLGLGDIDGALAEIEIALEQHRAWLPISSRIPIVQDMLGHDPRYHEIMRRMNFPEEWR